METEWYSCSLSDRGPLIADPSIFPRAGEIEGIWAIWCEGGFKEIQEVEDFAYSDAENVMWIKIKVKQMSNGNLNYNYYSITVYL